MPKIPLIEDLTSAPVPAGSALLVEYDAASQWYNACVTIAAGWIRSGGKVEYFLNTQPPDDLRSQLKLLGLDVELAEKEDRLQIWDTYAVGLGQKSAEKYSYDSLKVSDLTVEHARGFMRSEPAPGVLLISENFSQLSRFNEEKVWVEFALYRAIPGRKSAKKTAIRGIMNDVHSESAYKQLEAASNGIIDFKLQETDGETRNFMRIRSMRNVGFDSRWHPLEIGKNLEVTLEK